MLPNLRMSAGALTPICRPSFRKGRAAFAVDVQWAQLGVFGSSALARAGHSTQVKHMPSNAWSLSSYPPPAADHADPATGYPTRILREQVEEAERAQRERIEQSSELNTPAMRIRAWERLHRLTLPRGSAHSVLSVVAKATHLTLEQVREEQLRRSEPAAVPQRVDSRSTMTPT